MAKELNLSRIRRLRMKFVEANGRECTLSDEIIQQVIDEAKRLTKHPLDAELIEDMWDWEP